MRDTFLAYQLGEIHHRVESLEARTAKIETEVSGLKGLVERLRLLVKLWPAAKRIGKRCLVLAALSAYPILSLLHSEALSKAIADLIRAVLMPR